MLEQNTFNTHVMFICHPATMYAFANEDKTSMDMVFQTSDGVKLFIGNRASATDIAAHTAHRITCVLSVTNPGDQVNIDDHDVNKKIKWLALEFEDRPWGIVPWSRAQQFLCECVLVKKRHTLVHCTMGVSRSASLVVDFLVYLHGAQKTVKELCEMLRERRPCVRPNDSFLAQLVARSEMYRRVYCADCFVTPMMGLHGWCEVCKGRNIVVTKNSK